MSGCTWKMFRLLFLGSWGFVDVVTSGECAWFGLNLLLQRWICDAACLFGLEVKRDFHCWNVTEFMFGVWEKVLFLLWGDCYGWVGFWDGDMWVWSSSENGWDYVLVLSCFWVFYLWPLGFLFKQACIWTFTWSSDGIGGNWFGILCWICREIIHTVRFIFMGMWECTLSTFNFENDVVWMM